MRRLLLFRLADGFRKIVREARPGAIRRKETVKDFVLRETSCLFMIFVGDDSIVKKVQIAQVIMFD